jgi:hypothetical protein
MKRILSIIVILLTFSSFGQINGTYLPNTNVRPNVNVNIGFNTTTPLLNTNKNTRGPIIMLTGAGILITGVMMPPEKYTTPSGYSVDKPFFNQGLRALMVIGGSCLTTVGVVFTIKDNSKKSK